jgi:hypothetical protein
MLVHYLSHLTPLNFLAALVFLAAMNSPLALLRLVQALAPPSVVLSCVSLLHSALAGIVAYRFVDCLLDLS